MLSPRHGLLPEMPHSNRGRAFTKV